MSKPKLGSIRWIWQHFAKSLRSPKSTFVGEDHFGNKYYEEIRDEKVRRTTIAPDESPEVEIPNEWVAWLQHRRKTPPTQEEIERNFLEMLKLQKRGREADERERERSAKIAAENNADTDFKGIALSSEQPKSNKSSTSNFPVWDEYQITPGSNKSLSFENATEASDKTAGKLEMQGHPLHVTKDAAYCVEAISFHGTENIAIGVCDHVIVLLTNRRHLVVYRYIWTAHYCQWFIFLPSEELEEIRWSAEKQYS